MSREQWNLTKGLCWLASIPLAYLVVGPIAAIIVAFIPPGLVILWLAILGELSQLGINKDWPRKPLKQSDEDRDQPRGSN